MQTPTQTKTQRSIPTLPSVDLAKLLERKAVAIKQAEEAKVMYERNLGVIAILNELIQELEIGNDDSTKSS